MFMLVYLKGAQAFGMHPTGYLIRFVLKAPTQCLPPMGKYACYVATFKCESLRSLIPIPLCSQQYHYNYGRKRSYILKNPNLLPPGSSSSNESHARNYWWRSTYFRTSQETQTCFCTGDLTKIIKVTGSHCRSEFSLFCSWSDWRFG